MSASELAAEVMAATSVPLAEGAENLRRATDTAYWDFESLGPILMATHSSKS